MTAPITRRTILASVATAGVLTAAGMSSAEASQRRPPHRPGKPVKLTILLGGSRQGDHEHGKRAGAHGKSSAAKN